MSDAAHGHLVKGGRFGIFVKNYYRKTLSFFYYVSFRSSLTSMQRVVDIKINTILVYLVGHGFTEIALQLDNFFKVISQSSLILSREYMIQKGNYINWCPEIRPQFILLL